MDIGSYENEDFDLRREDGFSGQRMVVLPIESFSEYVESPLVRRLYLTDVGFFPRAEHHFMERKEGCDQNIFLYCSEGEGTVNIEGKRYILRENEAITIPRSQRHSYYANDTDPWSILWFHFKGSDTEYYPLKEGKIVRFQSNRTKNRMMYFFDLLFQTLDGSYTERNFIYISKVLDLILAETYIKEKIGEINEPNKHVTNIVRFMYAHLGEPLTLERICDEFGLSKSYVNAIFLRSAQRAPMDFFTNLKIREACNALRSSDRYIYEIAQGLGYKDQYYFSRLFKKIVGVSPKEYREGKEIYYK